MFAVIKLFSISITAAALWGEVCATHVLPMGSVPLRSDITGMELPLPIYWYHSKGNWLHYNFADDSFYIMKLCSRLFVLHCRSRPKYDRFRHFDPHFEEVRGGVEPWLESPWRLLITVIELLFLSRTVEALQGKTCLNSLLLEGWVSLSQDFRGKGRPWEYFLVSRKLDTFCYRTVQKLHRATCSRFDTIPACDRRTDRRTDGIAIANTALAMRALRRAVKNYSWKCLQRSKPAASETGVFRCFVQTNAGLGYLTRVCTRQIVYEPVWSVQSLPYWEWRSRVKGHLFTYIISPSSRGVYTWTTAVAEADAA